MNTKRRSGMLLSLLLLFSGKELQVFAQQAGVQQTQPSHTPQLQPLSLPHLYWHFLVYVNVLDRKSDELTAQGKGGDWLRKDLQTRLQFSDSDFAPIRASSQRLVSELAPISQQFQSLRSASPSASRAAQLQALIAQRETYISIEVTDLSQALSPAKRAALESFMTQFFAPKKLTYQAPSAQTNQ